jgi:hypothetical protein
MTASVNNLIDAGTIGVELQDRPTEEVEITSQRNKQEAVVIKMTARNKEEANKVVRFLCQEIGKGLLSVTIGE